MPVSANAQSPVENRLLAALPIIELERLLPDLELVSLTLGQVIYESSGQMTHVYFPAAPSPGQLACGRLRRWQSKDGINHVDDAIVASDISLDHFRVIHLDPLVEGNGHILSLYGLR